jgi:hypothetical protein
MSLPGFTAAAALVPATKPYQPYQTGPSRRGDDEPLVRPQFYRPIWCRGCWICDPRTMFCSCYYPCPVVAPPVGV